MELTVAMYARIHNMNFDEQNGTVKEYITEQFNKLGSEFDVLCPILWIGDVFMQCVWVR